jgi:hypothetical protein
MSLKSLTKRAARRWNKPPFTTALNSSPHRESYLVAVVLLVLSVDLLPFFLCLVFLAIVEPESVEFCAKTTVPVKSESPRAAVIIFFIRSYLLINNSIVALGAFNEYIPIPKVK